LAIDTKDIRLEQTDSKGRYVYAAPDGAEAAMTFSRAGKGLIIIDHTEVPDSMRGTGAGRTLVERAVADARAAGHKILPLCPFAASQFRRHREWADVLQPNTRPKP
jgi:predicted GNAT family acetyltransferase